MENILIEGLESFATAKGQGLKVSYNGNRTASVAPWLTEVQGYIKSIAVGGSVDVELKADGQYVNILAVNMATGKQSQAGYAPSNQPKPEDVSRAREVVASVTPVPAMNNRINMSVKDEFILAQVILKCAAEYVAHNHKEMTGSYGEGLTIAIDQLVGAFKYSLSGVKTL